jgi:hypothetical protein
VISWDWSAALLGAVYALPAAVVALSDRSRGLALAVGVLPAAIVGLMPTRRGRARVVVLGVCTGVPMFLGGLLADVPVLAVVVIAVLGVGSALLAARVALGQVAMTLSLPMVGVGLSYTDLGKAAGLGSLMVLGSLFACLVSMLWPEQPDRQPSGTMATARPAAPTLQYGLRLGAAGRHRRRDRLSAAPRARRLGMRRGAAGDAARRRDATPTQRGQDPLRDRRRPRRDRLRSS